MRPNFLTTPGVWQRTPRESLSRADYASPVTQFARRPGNPGRIRGWLLAIAIGLGLASWLVAWWSA